MLTDNALTDPLYGEIDGLMSAIGLRTVEAVSSVHQGMRSMRVVVYKEDGEVNTDDLAAAYNLIYPRYSIIYSDRDLQLEVSSPGLQRNFKDVYEFTLFKGKLVKVYSSTYSSNIEGIISDADDNGVTLTSALVQDTGESFETLSLSYDEIQKAKLTYRWEEKK